jgi:hypothetical protein
MREKWTISESKQVLTEYQNGTSYNQIAKIMNRSEASIKQFIAQFGISANGNAKRLSKVKAKIKDGTPLTKIAKDLKESVIEVAAMARTLQVKQPKECLVVNDDTKINQTLNNISNGIDINTLIDQVAVLQSTLRDTQVNVTEVNSIIDSDNPIMVIFLSDWHIGSIHTDLLKIKRVVNYIKDTPNVYAVFSGDVLDAAGAGSKHSSILHEQIIQPAVARQIAKGFFKLLGDKLLAYTAGCHDNWSVDQVDYDQVAEMSNSPYLGNGGTVNIMLGEQMYRMAVRHKFGGSTSSSIFIANKNYLLKSDANADIVAIGHHHVSGVSSEVYQGKERLFVRTGSAKGLDNYADRLGLGTPTQSELNNAFPCVILWQDSKKMAGFGNWEAASDIFNLINK